MDRIATIKRNFLSAIEIQDIKDKIHSANHLWQESSQIATFKFLPYGTYSVSDDVYKSTVPKYKAFLDENFSIYYKKIQETISDYFGKTAVYDEHRNKPGFHVIGPGILDYKNYNYHKDGFKNLRGYTIYSLIIPIQLPNTGAGLNYIIDGVTQELTYDVGSLYMWEGNLLHSIKPFYLDEGEYRITMQMHIAHHLFSSLPSFKLKNEYTIFW